MPQYIKTLRLNSMWNSVWFYFSTPFVAMFTGKVRGYSISRNPLKHVGFFLWGFRTALFTIFIYPFLLLLLLFGYWNLSRTGNDVRLSGSGLQLFSKRRGLGKHFAWSEIQILKREFKPPFMTPELVLVSGEMIELPLADWQMLETACLAQGIKVEEHRQDSGQIMRTIFHEAIAQDLAAGLVPSASHHEAFPFHGIKEKGVGRHSRKRI